MSIFFDFEVGPVGRRFRRAVDGDKHDIMALMNANSDKLFGVVDIGSLIELSALSICMIGEEKEVLGFMALCDSPNVPGVDPAEWETWIRNMFQKYFLSRNTLFIHFICCEESVVEYFLEEALVTVFDHDFYLNQNVLVVPPGCPEDALKILATKKRNVHKFCAKRLDDIENFHYLFTFNRNEFCPKLKMRRAVEEDNDDIIEILDKKCPRLKDLYGNYYVSEIIGRHPESNRKIIVADHQDRAVGVMCLNSDINYKNLETTYELHPFYGFKRATPLEKEKAKRTNSLLTTFGEPIMNGKWSPFQRMKKIEHHVEHKPSKEHDKNARRAKTSSKVNFSHRASMRKSLDQIIYKHNHSDDISDKELTNSQADSREPSYSVADLLEEDPFDYEIVNIDTQLLAIPEALSFEHLPEGPQFWRQRKLSEIHRRRMSRVSLPKIKQPEDSNRVIYHGEPNAFIIELFGFHDDVHYRHAFDLLEAAFEVMKNYDYCLIRVPCKDKVFPLLEHFTFVPTKSDVCSPYALYVAHRSSVLGKLRVRPAELADVPQIANLLQNIEGQETVWTIENSVLTKDQYQAYVFLSGLSLIGVGIVEPPEQIDFIRAKFNLDLYHNHKYHFKGHGIDAGFTTLKVLLTYPVFEVHYRFFARDIMRFSGSCSLLWMTAYRNKWVAHKANSIVSAMIPLTPRKSEIDCTFIPELNKMTTLSKKIVAFSTWFLGRKMTTLPKVDINMRILVVGASRTAMAFLDTLLFSDASSYLNFTNVTLVSPHGLPYLRQAAATAEMMFPRYRTTADKHVKSVPYTYYVNVVHGTMVEIDKGEKYITLSSGSKHYYDLLFLFLGKQYQHPNYLQELFEQRKDDTDENDDTKSPYVRLDVPRHCEADELFLTDVLPENVFVVNNITEANHSVKYIRNILWRDFDYNVIVYGASIHAYCCIAALLEMKIPPENIIFVEPFPCEHKTRVPVFCNVYVDQTIKEVINNLKIKVYRSYHFQSWTVDEYNVVTHVNFLSHYQMVKLECAAFFYYGKKGVSIQALNAVKKSGLVYDGGILIDNEFRTKDPSIYAAGPATRYYRRFYADAYRLKYYDAYEVGEKLGTQIRNELDPLFTPRKPTKRSSVRFSKGAVSNLSSFTSHSYENSKLSFCSTFSGLNRTEERLPDLKKPIVTHCTLPGGLQYLDVRPPGRKLPHYYVQTLQYNGFVMETFKSGYFKIHLDSEYVVDGVTCLSPERYSLDNFKNIYGLSATVLNNAYLRYTAKKLDNFYEFFRSKWALYLYHDRVQELFLMAKELRPKGQKSGRTLKDALYSVRQRLSNPSYKFETKMRLRSNFEQSPHVEAITDYVIEWLSENDVLLPMYLQRETQAELLSDLENHPAFRKRSSLVNYMRKMF